MTPQVPDDELIRVLNLLDEYKGNLTQAALKAGMSRAGFQARLGMAGIRGLNKDSKASEKPLESPAAGRKHCVIPDVQAKQGVALEHLKWAGQYIAEKRPDVIICIGDFADMASLSSYDRGKASAENKRYKYDIDAAHQAMELLMTPIVNEQGYTPQLHLTLGNHENRIVRFADDTPAMDGAISVKDLGYEAWGWEVHPFLQPVEVDGISYCHYFYNPNTGKPYGGANLDTRLKTIGMSFTMGHQQGLSVAIRDLANGKRHRGLVAGSFYQHAEDYKGPQGNGHWHGLIMKHEVCDGNYDLMEVSLNYLRKRYG